MCLHDRRTVVTGGKLAIWQCDICGAPLWWLDVPEDVVPVALDVDAMRMWEKRADDAAIKRTIRHERLRAENPIAWREELRKAINVSNPITLLYEERQRLIEEAESRLSAIRQARGEVDW